MTRPVTLLAGALAVATVLFGLSWRPATPEGRVPPATATGPGFDGARAFSLLERQVAFGPRVPGAPGHRDCARYLEETLKQCADSVERQTFTARLDGKTLPMVNLIARWKGEGAAAAGSGVLLCAHWDTRPTADYEFSPANRLRPIPGANDGASGVAVLLELARQFRTKRPPAPVMIVLFDGEDYGPGIDRMFLGSTHFARNLPAGVPRKGILLDMVGDRDLVIPQEAHSVRQAPEVVRQVYAAARRLGLQRQFPDRLGDPIEDDHVPLHRVGLKVIDLIDFDYGPGHSWWHTLADTPDKCSVASLQAVGDVVRTWVREQR